MKREFSEIGTIPVTTSIIESSYPELKSANKKVTWLEKQGFIIRLKRGLYVANPKHSGKTLSSELIANSSKVIFRYMKDVETYLEQDIRMDMDEFYNMDANIFEEYINVGKKADSISTLLKLLRR